MPKLFIQFEKSLEDESQMVTETFNNSLFGPSIQSSQQAGRLKTHRISTTQHNLQREPVYKTVKSRYGGAKEESEITAMLTNRASNYKVPYPGYSFEFESVDKYTKQGHKRISQRNRDNEVNKSQPSMLNQSHATLEESTRIATTNKISNKEEESVSVFKQPLNSQFPS